MTLTNEETQQDDAGDRRVIDVKVVAMFTDAEMVAGCIVAANSLLMMKSDL